MVRIIDDGGDGSVVFGFDKQKISRSYNRRTRAGGFEITLSVGCVTFVIPVPQHKRYNN